MRTFVYTKELIDKFHTPVCKTVVSTPKTDVNPLEDAFLVTAEPTEEYLAKLSRGEASINRTAANYKPVFFVFECDHVELEKQKELYNSVLAGQYHDNVFSITSSGNKSLHMLVYINPEDRENVRHDFHYYWSKTAKMLFGDNASLLDAACATVGRLSRLPGGTRDTGVRQVCSYMNEGVVGIDLTNLISKHEKELLVASYLAESKKKAYKKEDLTIEQEIEKMRKMRKKNSSGSFELACSVVLDKNLPSGENYIGAFRSLVSRGFSEEFIRDLYFEVVQAVHRSNMPKNFDKYWEAAQC